MANHPKDSIKLFKKLMKEGHNIKTVDPKSRSMRLGFLTTFVYDPKHKKTLPYYDRLPIAIVLAKYGDRFLGINLHHIPWTRRVQLGRALMRRTKNKNRIRYSDIKAAWKDAKLPLALAYICLRTYLFSHIRSEVKLFGWPEYEKIVSEVKPVFKKQGQATVYKNNMGKYFDQKKGTKKK